MSKETQPNPQGGCGKACVHALEVRLSRGTVFTHGTSKNKFRRRQVFGKDFSGVKVDLDLKAHLRVIFGIRFEHVSVLSPNHYMETLFVTEYCFCYPHRERFGHLRDGCMWANGNECFRGVG